VADHILIRDYTEADEAEVISIHDLARPIELKGSCDSRAFVPLRQDPGDLQEFRSCRKLVAQDGKQIVGFIGMGDNEIGWLYVRPDVSRQGVGRSLLNHALGMIRQEDDTARATSVFVLEANEPAIALYRSAGFELVETFNSKNNGYPCVVLKWILSPTRS